MEIYDFGCPETFYFHNFGLHFLQLSSRISRFCADPSPDDELCLHVLTGHLLFSMFHFLFSASFLDPFWFSIGSQRAFSRNTYALNYIFFQGLPLFLAAVICVRWPAEGCPRCIAKRWSWAGGRRPPLADSSLIASPSFSSLVAFQQPLLAPQPWDIYIRISKVISSPSSPHVKYTASIFVGPPLAGLNF